MKQSDLDRIKELFDELGIRYRINPGHCYCELWIYSDLLVFTGGGLYGHAD